MGTQLFTAYHYVPVYTQIHSNIFPQDSRTWEYVDRLTQRSYVSLLRRICRLITSSNKSVRSVEISGAELTARHVCWSQYMEHRKTS
jgi:hypothetical protein